MSLILNKENFDEVINGTKPVLVDFWATWCGPCKMLAPTIEELAEELKDEIVVAKLDVDQVQEIAVKYQVMSIPTLVLFKDGKEVKRTVGFRPKAQLLDFLK
ncbi:MAG: thioredoxin [Oscillospiraceae bacterium]|nr:thioredoxin [Oscillospiraceae bacterium]